MPKKGAKKKTRKKAYLAGPLGFSEAGAYFMNEVVIRRLESLGYEVLNPWTLTPPSETLRILKMAHGPKKRNAWRKLNPMIAERNTKAIDRCDFVFAVLDGVDVDSGTAAEIGYAFAKGKLIVGYRGDFRLSADNEGATVNLQVEFFIRKSGGEIIAALGKLKNAIKRLGKRSSAV